ncbi:MAG: alanine racemase [Bacillota bacterium]
MAEIRRTHVVIDLDSFSQNVRNLKSCIGPKTLLMAVIKADGYGHGALEIAHTALQSGADWLGVATPDEGGQLREAGITAPILVLSGAMEQGMNTVVKYDLRLTVFNIGGLWRLDEEAKRQGKHVKVHLKVDTGMNRVGVHKPKRLNDVLSRIEQCANLELEGVFTHFATSDDADKTFTLLQNQRFQDTVRVMEEKGHTSLLMHAANSAAILDLPETHYDMVRAGIAMYGCYPSAEVQKTVPLYPVMKWKTVILHVKKIPAGETVSYGRTFTTERDTFVATIPVGYGDGYKRLLSNRAHVLVRGEKAPVIGRVCMDQTMIDVTDIPDVLPGDEVVLLGRQGNESVTADQMAEWAETISYEILLSVSQRVPRVYKGGGNA